MNVIMMLIMMEKRTRRTIVLLFLIRIKLIRNQLMELVMYVTMIATEMVSRTMRMFAPAIVLRPNLHLGT